MRLRCPFSDLGGVRFCREGCAPFWVAYVPQAAVMLMSASTSKRTINLAFIRVELHL
ncbi:MAG UNVERIFIED_CONTAM: hypothetical protein LVT10_04960 [Anaerolineae bacterium]|jgi:hypothetical protein